MYYKHGYAMAGNKHPVYRLWQRIKLRCYDSKNYHKFHNYGGRGIRVCDEWLNDSTRFINWALANGWRKGLHIDRIDNDGNYEPSNCRFVTAKENNLNRRRPKNLNKYIGIKPSGEKWEASITVDGKYIYLGVYGNKIEASLARDVFILNNKLIRELTFNNPITEIK